MNFQLTENAINIRLFWRLVLWYCIDPHMAGVRLYRRDLAARPLEKTWRLW